MSKTFSLPLLEDPGELSRLGGWSEEVYRDLMALQSGAMDAVAFRRKYGRTVAILQLDMTGMTKTAMGGGSLLSFLRVLNAQKVCVPALLDHGASHVRSFADDLTAVFPEPEPALDAALTLHRRMAEFNTALSDAAQRVQVCIGLGYGEVYQIGLDGAMGDEMNRASKLGEDTAKGGETLVTEAFHECVKHRADVRFQPQSHEELPFPYFLAIPR